MSDQALLIELETIFRLQHRGVLSFVDFLRKRSDPFCVARLQFFDFVAMSSQLDYSKLLEKISDKEKLHLERCVCFIAQKDHKNVLKILASDICDPLYAQKYSVENFTEEGIPFVRYLLSLYLSDSR